MQTTLDRLTSLIRSLPLKDFAKLREIIDKEEKVRKSNDAGEISEDRALEVLRIFHDDFYIEEKDRFSRRELRSAIQLVLLQHEKKQSQ